VIVVWTFEEAGTVSPCFGSEGWGEPAKRDQGLTSWGGGGGGIVVRFRINIYEKSKGPRGVGRKGRTLRSWPQEGVKRVSQKRRHPQKGKGKDREARTREMEGDQEEERFSHL